ncbi:putative reverse transcriptase domain-containing protein [Tanacetum coccineum]
MHFLGYVVNQSGIHVDPSKIEAVKNWKAPTTPSEYEWGEKEEEAFQTLKNNLCDAPILSLPDGVEDFVVYCDALNQGLGCVLMQRDLEALLVWHKEYHLYGSQEPSTYFRPKGAKYAPKEYGVKEMILAAQSGVQTGERSCRKATWLRSTDGNEGRREFVFYG